MSSPKGEQVAFSGVGECGVEVLRWLHQIWP